MSLQIPNYVIDERLITAIRRNVTSYLTSYFYNRPKNIYQFYYHVSTKSNTGLFESLFFTPTKFILTPLGFAILYGSLKSLDYLLELGSNPNTPGVAIDCPVEDAKLRWKIDLFRMHEVYPVCLTTPDSVEFKKMINFGLKMSSDYKLRFRLVTLDEAKERSELCRGVWELAWIFWIKMRDPLMLLKVTDLLLINGQSATHIMERVNLLAMLKKIFKVTAAIPNREEASFVIDLLKILLWTGCDFDETQLAEYIYPCVEIFFTDKIIIYSFQQEFVHRYKVLQGIFNLSKTFRKCISERGLKMTNLVLVNNKKSSSLEMFCVVVIRRCLTGVLFNKKLAVLNIDVNFKEIIQVAIPESQKSQFMFLDPNSLSKQKSK